MSVPTIAELTSLRTHPHNTKLYLSIYQPEIVFSATVTGTIAKGEREVDYYDVTIGNKAFVNSGMTMLVGSSVGDESKGRIRVRSATGTASITVAENSHIDWALGDTLTVLDFYEINAVYPRIIQDPADDTQTLWYKDYDITYAGQNSALGSFVCLGSHYAGFVGDVFYTASGTHNLKSEALTYYWSFDVGASTTGSNVHTPGNIYYDTPGHYTTTLTVSGTSAGAGNTSYRHISIYDRPENGTGAHLPILSWELQDLSGSRDQGGYFANLRIHQDLSLVYSVGGEYKPIVREGDLVVIFAEDWYGNTATKQSIGGNSLNRQSIVFVGYILKGSLQYNYKDSYVDFAVGSPTEIMKMAEGLGVSVMDDYDPETITARNEDIPSGWVAVLNMDMKRAIYHYLRWHTTVLNCCDVLFKGTDRSLQYFDSDRTSIYDAVNTVLSGAWMGKLVSDRQGALFCERDIFIEPAIFPTTFTVSKQDWLDNIIIDQSRQERTSWIELGGIAYTSSTGTYVALLSNAPGLSPGYRGKTVRQQGLALTSQVELNTIAGNLYAQNNSIYPSIDVKLAGNYRNFDIAPQEKVPLTVALTDTVRGITFTAKNFFIQRLQYQYNSKDETFSPGLSVSELCSGFAGDTVTIPAIPPTEGDGGFHISVPPITIPPFPGISIGLNVYDDSVLKVFGCTDISFDASLTVEATGTAAYIDSLGGGYGNRADQWIGTHQGNSRGTWSSGTSSGSIVCYDGIYNIYPGIDSVIDVTHYFNLTEIVDSHSAKIYAVFLPEYEMTGDVYQKMRIKHVALHDIDSNGLIGTDTGSITETVAVTIPADEYPIRSDSITTTIYPQSGLKIEFTRYGTNVLDTYTGTLLFMGFFIHYL